jgi:hypothetical protein
MAGRTTQKLQIAREGTAGTPETADFTVWRGTGGHIGDDRDVTIVQEMIGISAQTTRNYTPRLGGVVDINATEATFEQLPHLFEMGIKTATPAQDGTGTGYVYTYATANTSEDALKYYTVESGDTVDQRVMSYTFAESITLSWTATESLMMSASLRGRQSSDLVGGFDTSTTPTVETILGGKMSFYEDDAGTFPATTQVTGTLLSGDITINTGRKPKYISDDGSLFFNFVYLDPNDFKAEGSITLEHDAAAVALIADFEANTSKSLRFLWTGDAVADATGATYTNKTLIYDVACVITSVDPLTDEDGNGVVVINFESGYSVTDTAHMQAIIVNELSALPG